MLQELLTHSSLCFEFVELTLIKNTDIKREKKRGKYALVLSLLFIVFDNMNLLLRQCEFIITQ